MKIALHDSGSEEHLQFMHPLGVEYVVSSIGPGKSGALEVEQVQRKKDYYAEHGLIWDVIENLSPEIYYKVMLARRDASNRWTRSAHRSAQWVRPASAYCNTSGCSWEDCEPNTVPGEVDMPGVLLALQETGFTGPVRALAPPGMVGDSAWGHKGRAYDLG